MRDVCGSVSMGCGVCGTKYVWLSWRGTRVDTDSVSMEKRMSRNWEWECEWEIWCDMGWDGMV